MQVTPAPCYIGIDLAWARCNFSGIAVIDADARVIDYRYTDSLETMMDVIGALVGVDAPLIITNAEGHRPNERAFLKTFARYGLGMHAANTVLFEKRFEGYAGFELYACLTAEGFGFDRGNLYEVYPHATILSLFNDGKVLRYKSSVPKAERVAALKRLQTLLFERLTVPNTLKKDPGQLKGRALKGYEDFLDALVCGYTLLHCTRNGCLYFGDDTEGKLLTPEPPPL